MKRIILTLLLCALLIPAAAGAADLDQCTFSRWAEASVDKAVEIGLIPTAEGDLRDPIQRGTFARHTSVLVALAYDTDPEEFYPVAKFRAEKAIGGYCSDIWLWFSNSLGILRGRENGDLDGTSYITRQEAAVMLARAYRLYTAEVPEVTEPLVYSDADQIADWAEEDVRLMTQLGILNGVENNCFAPLARYSIEQCYVTLVRLYEKTCTGEPKCPDPFAVTARENLAAGIVWEGTGTTLSYCENEDAFVIGWCRSGLPSLAGTPCFVTYVGPDQRPQQYTCQLFAQRLVQGTEATLEAKPTAVSISPDGTKVLYQFTADENFYLPNEHFQANKDRLWEKGPYTVTIDLASGERSYERSGG